MGSAIKVHRYKLNIKFSIQFIFVLNFTAFKLVQFTHKIVAHSNNFKYLSLKFQTILQQNKHKVERE